MIEFLASLTGFMYVLACVCFVTGACGVLWFVVALLQPMLRGLSYGLHETVMYYKGGADLGRVFTRFLRALTFDFLTWGIINSTTQSVSNDMCSWYGIFRWHFKTEFTRKASKQYNAEQKAKPAPVENADANDDFGV